MTILLNMAGKNGSKHTVIRIQFVRSGFNLYPVQHSNFPLILQNM